MTASELLGVVVAAFDPATRLEDRAAREIAHRITQRGESYPDGFVPTAAAELARAYLNQLRRQASLPPLDKTPTPMTLDRATAIYNARLKRRA